MSNGSKTFSEAVFLVLVRMQFGNFKGALSTLSSAVRLAEKGRETHDWLIGELENAIHKQQSALPFPYTMGPVLSEFTSAEVIEDWELCAWDKTHEQEREQRSEQATEHGYDESWAWEAPTNYHYAKYPDYLAPAIARRKEVQEAEKAVEKARQEEEIARQDAEWAANGWVPGKWADESDPFSPAAPPAFSEADVIFAAVVKGLDFAVTCGLWRDLPSCWQDGGWDDDAEAALVQRFCALFGIDKSSLRSTDANELMSDFLGRFGLIDSL